MTGRERLVAAGRGGSVDRAPVVVWPTDPSHPLDPRADGWVVDSPAEAVDALAALPDSAVLVTVVSPLGRDLQGERALLQQLRDDPARGARRIDELKSEVQADIDAALEAGADGIVYCLGGANPDAATPMEYGGHFLEVDREILADAAGARFNVLWVRGKSEPYLDFVIDLPAHAFAWDMIATGIPPEAFRSARAGAIAGHSATADVYLVNHFDAADEWLASLEAKN